MLGVVLKYNALGLLTVIRATVRAYSYYNRTGGNDDERPINGHTAVSCYRSELCYDNRTGGNDDDERHIDGHTAVSDYRVRTLH